MTAKQEVGPAPATVVLVGAGHAHLHILSHADQLVRAGIRLVLVAPAIFDYSGLATGVLSGALRPGDNTLDVGRLASAHGVDHRVCKARAIDVRSRTVRVADGSEIAFDFLSLNVGSVVADPSGLAALPLVFSVKPLSELAKLRGHLEKARGDGGSCLEIVIAGSGPSAFEVAASIAGLCRRLGVAQRITIVGSMAESSWAPRAAHRTLVRRLQAKGVRFHDGVVVDRSARAVRTETGEQLPCDVLVLATGLEGGFLATESGLPVDKGGRLRVTNELHSIATSRIFAVGDCSIVEGDERPALGVFGVRAGPILLQNLCAAAQGRSLIPYRPQKKWLSILDLGDGTGLAMYERLWLLGRAPLWLKRWLDRSFLARHRMG